DVTDDAACARLVEQALARFGRLTTLVNSAGVRPVAADPAPPPAEWRRVVEVNLTGTYLPSRAALGALRASGAASITNLASIYGLVGGSMAPSYAASKGGVANLTRQLALNWAPTVRVNCVCPGVIETPMTRFPRSTRSWTSSGFRHRRGEPAKVSVPAARAIASWLARATDRIVGLQTNERRRAESRMMAE
ncbi:MAG: hypothetical protein DME06_16890, partial [Candidatus Rokuibacteriota bacterium]